MITDVDLVEYQLRMSGGVVTQLGSESTYGHLDEIEAGGGLLRPLVESMLTEPSMAGVRRVLVIATGKLAALTRGSTVIVGGVSYEAREHFRRPDSTTMVLLKDL